METYQLSLPPAVVEDATDLPARLTIGIGRPGREILFDAEPLDGTVRVTAYGGTDIEFDVEDFALISELLIRAVT